MVAPTCSINRHFIPMQLPMVTVVANIKESEAKKTNSWDEE